MVDAYQRQGALDYRALEVARRAVGEADAAVRMWVVAACGQLCLRGDANAHFGKQVESVWGVPLPIVPNSVSGSAPVKDEEHAARAILWLGPDEWLAICASNELARLRDALDESLGAQHALISDVSHARVRIAVQGPRARDVLCKGCSLDLDPIAFGAGRCAQTPLARAHMLLHQVDDSPCYHVYVQRSVAGYVYAWLEDAAREFRRVSGG